MDKDRHTDFLLEKTFRRSSRIAAVLLSVLGVLIICGNIFDIVSLQLGTSAFALSLVCFAISLFCHIDDRFTKVSRPLAYFMCVSGLVLPLLNVARYFFGLAIADLCAGVSFGGLEAAELVGMAPSDALGLVLIGTALLLKKIKVRSVYPTEVLAFSALLISIMTLLGVLLKIDTFCVFMSCARINVLGGSTFALLCAAVFVSNPEAGIMSLLASKNAGGIVARRLIPACLIIPVLASWAKLELEKIQMPQEVAITLVVMGIVSVFISLILLCAWSIEKTDRARLEAVNRFRQSELRNRMVIQQAIDAFVAIDSAGLVRDWNDRAEFTFGWSRDEALGRSIFELSIPERFIDNARAALSNFANDKTDAIPSQHIESVGCHRDGHEFPVELSLFPITTNGNTLICGFVRDITERKEIEQRYREFYSTVSHELRSPLTSIHLSTKMLISKMSHQLPEAGKRFLEIADNNIDRLIRLVNDLLDVKRIEDGAFDLELQSVKPHTLIQIAVDGLRAVAEKKEITLNAVIDNDDPVSVDADRIVQVLTNLISNAIKFTPDKSSVNIIVKRARNLKRMRFLVRDEGPGIQASDVHKLFSKFGQLAAGRTMKGTGLGLAISKAIIEQHKGEINLESTVGKGTTFWFELPCSLEVRAIKDDQLKTVRTEPLKEQDRLKRQPEQVETNV